MWVEAVLDKLNQLPCSDPTLPSPELQGVIGELLDTSHYSAEMRSEAIVLVDAALKRDGLAVVVDERQLARLRPAARPGFEPVIAKRVYSEAERAARSAWEAFLANASEDAFTEQLLVPLFRALGFTRIAIAGHRDKSLEFGKDLWMKLKLPIGTWIYFAAQVKRDRIDAAGSGRNSNVATVLDQVRMMIDHPVFDEDTNTTVLIDHALIIASGEITKAARDYLVRQLDASKRRHIIFIDRTNLLDLLLDVALPLPAVVS